MGSIELVMTRAFRIGVVLCGIGSPLAAAAQVTLPHTFTPNTPARASEVNENFTAVKDAVDDAVERVDAAETQLATLAQTPLGGLKVRVNDVVVGTVFATGSVLSLGSVLALNERGIFINLDHSNPNETPGASSALQAVVDSYFDQPGCQGNMSVANIASFPQTSLIFRQGVVFGAPEADGSITAMYAKGDPATISVASHRSWDIMNSGWVCFDIGVPFNLNGVPALPNDPDVTGVPSDISGPVRVSLN